MRAQGLRAWHTLNSVPMAHKSSTWPPASTQIKFNASSHPPTLTDPNSMKTAEDQQTDVGLAASAQGPHFGALRKVSPYLRSLLKLISGAGLLIIVYFWCQYFYYDEFYRIFGPSMSRLGLVYTYSRPLTPPVDFIDMYDSFYILLLWMPLGGGALFVTVAQRLPNDAKPRWLRNCQLLVCGMPGGFCLVQGVVCVPPGVEGCGEARGELHWQAEAVWHLVTPAECSQS